MQALSLVVALFACIVATCLAICWGGWWSFGLIGFLALPFVWADIEDRYAR